MDKRTPKTKPTQRTIVITGFTAAAIITTIAALAFGIPTGAFTATELLDPGAATRYFLPLAIIVHDIAGALTVGTAFLAATTLRQPGKHRNRNYLPTSAATAIHRTLIASSTTWAIAALTSLILRYSSISASPLTDPTFGQQLTAAITGTAYFQYFTFALIAIAIAAVIAAGPPTPTLAAAVAALGSLAWYSIAQTGHAAAAGSHELAVSGWWLHALGASAWLGGLAALALAGAATPTNKLTNLRTSVERYSRIAFVAALIVIASGIINGALRFTHPKDLASWYGAMLITKTVLTTGLILAGYHHRTKLIPALKNATTWRPFWKIIGAELAGFSFIMGVSGILSRTASPRPDTPETTGITPAEIVTGQPLPPWPTGIHWLIEWAPDTLWVIVCFVLAERYLHGYRLLRARGDHWPAWKLALWLTAIITLAYLLNGAPMVYGTLLFSAHMLQHMLLSMLVPMMLVLASPLNLLLRATIGRSDGTRGIREWILWFVHTPWAQFFANPVVAAINFTGSIIIFYFSPLFAMAVSNHIGHHLMTVHFLLAGYLFAQVLIGDDPGIKRPAYPMRIVLLFATMAFHAFFGVSLMSSDSVIASTYFSSLGWGIDLLEDQRYGGGVAWGIGEVPTLVLALIVAMRWSQSDAAIAKRNDRKAERDGDADLKAYNDMLAQRRNQNPN